MELASKIWVLILRMMKRKRGVQYEPHCAQEYAISLRETFFQHNYKYAVNVFLDHITSDVIESIE